MSSNIADQRRAHTKRQVVYKQSTWEGQFSPQFGKFSGDVELPVMTFFDLVSVRYSQEQLALKAETLSND